MKVIKKTFSKVQVNPLVNKQQKLYTRRSIVRVKRSQNKVQDNQNSPVQPTCATSSEFVKFPIDIKMLTITSNKTFTTKRKKSKKQVNSSLPMTSNENDDMETSSEENISDNDQEAPPPNKKIQTGMERYITITGKKKQKPTTNNEQVKPNEDTTTTNPGSSNYYSILADKSNDVNETIRKTTKPPPIYIRQAASNKLTTEIGKIVGADNFYIVDLKRGDIKETKVQVVSEVKYTALVNWLDSKKMQYYTYQLKSAKGLKAVIKGIDHLVEPQEISEELKAKGFETKSVHNIINRSKKPQPMFLVELTPETSVPPKGKPHPIYNLKYLLHRRITIEEPHKRSGPVQCQNCQEYGHTRTYCKLSSVCVICGKLHEAKACPSNKADPNSKKCSNCGGNHTANYRGCPVYSAINKLTAQKKYSPPTTYKLQHIHQTQNNQPAVTNFTSQPCTQQTFCTPPQPTYAEMLRFPQPTIRQSHIPTSTSPTSTPDTTTQILLTLASNIQQLTNTMHQMQVTLNKQTEILSQLLGK